MSTHSVLSRLSSFGTCCASANFGLSDVEQHPGGHAADGELRRAIEKAAAIDGAVHVLVENQEQFLIEILRGLAFHVRASGGSECSLEF